MYAYSPWSGHYTINPTVWTSAQTTQFTQAGWIYLAAEGKGLLPGGGSWVTYVPPTARPAWNRGTRPLVTQVISLKRV